MRTTALAGWSVFLLLAFSSHLSNATEAVFSRVEVNGYIQDIGCPANSGGGYDCGSGSDRDHYAKDLTGTTSASVSVTGFAPDPFVGGTLSDASARAQTELWSTRAEAHAVSAGVLRNEPAGVSMEEGKAIAKASSRWSAPITFERGIGIGTATMRFRITGSLSIAGPPEVSSGTVGFALMSTPIPGFDPDLADPVGPAVTGFFLETEDTTINRFFDVTFGFVYGQEQQVIGMLEVTAVANTYFKITEGAGEGGGELIEGPFAGTVHADMFSTVQVDRLILPAGATAVGANGAALPFAVVAVPEPQTYVLLALGVVLVAGVARYRRAAATAL